MMTLFGKWRSKKSHAAIFCACVFAAIPLAPIAAMVGGAPPAADGAGRAVVMILGSHGTACTATAIARDLLLTAAHCVPPDAEYKLVASEAGQTPVLKDIARVERDPQFDLKRLFGHLATADVALAKLAASAAGEDPAGAARRGRRTGRRRRRLRGGGLWGYRAWRRPHRRHGARGNTGRHRPAWHTADPPVDPRTKGESAGLGACAGDSGAPVFRDNDGRFVIIGVVSWSTGPKLSAGCGGLTGVTPLARYRAWIVQTARALGSPLAP